MAPGGAALLRLNELARTARDALETLQKERNVYIKRRDEVNENLGKLAKLAIPAAALEAARDNVQKALDSAQTTIDRTNPDGVVDTYIDYKANHELATWASAQITGPPLELAFQIMTIIGEGELDRAGAATDPSLFGSLAKVNLNAPMEQFFKTYKNGVYALLNLLRPGEAALDTAPRASALVKNIRLFLQLYDFPQGPFRKPFDKTIPPDIASSVLIACIVPALQYAEDNNKGPLTSDISTKAATQVTNIFSNIKHVTLPAGVKVVRDGSVLGNISCPFAIGLGDFETIECIKHVEAECGPQPTLDKVNRYYADLWAACMQAKAEWVKAGKPVLWPASKADRVNTVFTSWYIMINKDKNDQPKVFHADSGYAKSRWVNAK